MKSKYSDEVVLKAAELYEQGVMLADIEKQTGMKATSINSILARRLGIMSRTGVKAGPPIGNKNGVGRKADETMAKVNIEFDNINHKQDCNDTDNYNGTDKPTYEYKVEKYIGYKVNDKAYKCECGHQNPINSKFCNECGLSLISFAYAKELLKKIEKQTDGLQVFNRTNLKNLEHALKVLEERANG